MAFQKILQLAYVDKFLSDVHLEFRDKYKNELRGTADAHRCFQTRFEFGDELRRLLRAAEDWSSVQAKLPKQMRTFSDSAKSKKTVSSMIERKDGDPTMGGKKTVRIVEAKPVVVEEEEDDDRIGEDVLMANRRRLADKLARKTGKCV